jgi:hypothetical protein
MIIMLMTDAFPAIYSSSCLITHSTYSSPSLALNMASFSSSTSASSLPPSPPFVTHEHSKGIVTLGDMMPQRAELNNHCLVSGRP